MAHKISVMHKGEIVEKGLTSAIFRNMKHPYTKMLFNASSHKVALPTAVTKDPLLEVSNLSRDYILPKTKIFEVPEFSSCYR